MSQDLRLVYLLLRRLISVTPRLVISLLPLVSFWEILVIFLASNIPLEVLNAKRGLWNMWPTLNDNDFIIRVDLLLGRVLTLLLLLWFRLSLRLLLVGTTCPTINRGCLLIDKPCVYFVNWKSLLLKPARRRHLTCNDEGGTCVFFYISDCLDLLMVQ